MARYAPIGMIFFFVFFIILCSMFLLNRSDRANQTSSYAGGSAVQSDAINLRLPMQQDDPLSHVNNTKEQSVKSPAQGTATDKQ